MTSSDNVLAAAPAWGPQPVRSRTHITRTTLADGRELVYFDEQPRGEQPGPDSRPPEPRSAASELRHDILLDEWVIIAGHRQTRTHLPGPGHCPLCPSSSTQLTEIPAETYDVVIFENRFPALSDHIPGDAVALPEGTRPGIGRCEVVSFAPDHETSFAGLSLQRVATVLEAWTDRTRALSERPDAQQIFIFENRGSEIGVTLSHPHGQIYAYPFLPPRTRSMLAAGARARRCLHCHSLEHAGRRIVIESEHWTAFVPHAARWPFEIYLYPRRHLGDLTELTTEERAEFPWVYRALLRCLDNVFGIPMPYISNWQQAPVHGPSEYCHLFLQLFSTRRAPDKLKFLAGSESAMGVFINDIRPEQAADILRHTYLALLNK